MKSLFFIVLLGIGVSFGGVAVAEDADAPAFTDQQIEFFETKVRPVLVDHCYSCHSHSAKKNKGGFYLDSREGILDAYLAEPGEPTESLMIEAVHYKDPTMQMPPEGKLPDAAIADLEKWVEMGMPWPKEAAPGEGEVFDLAARQKAHWAWTLPKRSNNKKDIDAFIDARLAKEGLKPAPAADKATLIRRVTLDLTGLPPTAEEINAFVNDDSPQAYGRLVDRLLASPRYGEKWGRHWLDLVRYAESYGHEFDFNIPHAWKYRDYVIRALNDDVPYDRFTEEHIAGDLIPPRIHPQTKVNEAVKATGWWFLHEQTHATTDVRLHEADRIDNQIDALSKTFLGVTVACARCHDHKFDAISDEDYYSLAGYMQSSRQQEAYLDRGGQIEASLKRVRSVREQGQRLFDRLDAPKAEPTTIEHADTRVFEDFNDGSLNGWQTTGWAWGQTPTVPGQWDPSSGKAAAVMPGVAHSGLLGEQAMGTLRSPEFDYQERHIWLRVKGKGQVNMVIDSFTIPSHYSKLLFEGLNQTIDTEGQWKWIKLSAKREFYHGNGNHRAHLELVDDHADGHLILDEVRFGDKDEPPNPQSKAVAQSVKPSADARFADLTARFNAVASKTPAPERVLAITDGSGEDSYVHIRGSWHGKGEDQPRRLLTALGGETMPAPKQGSGRDALAQRIIDPQNPLTARVQVNRLWHHLFGRGIAPTVDNFGVLGLAPSHPELLDHLAVVFVEDDKWSNKAMIKRIVMSRAYRRSSDKQDAQAEKQDPTNGLLRRQNIRRLTSESIRDSILFVSGSLNEQRFGKPVSVYLTAFMQGRGKPKEAGPLDGQGRRSIYISVRRNFLSPMMLTFDTPIPFSTVGKRNVTNVPAQSLTLMNDPFVHEQAGKWADRLIADGSTSVDQRLDAVFTAALGRRPTDAERTALSAFITQQAGTSDDAQALKDEQAWREVCHAVYNLKGFVYVR